MFTGIVQTSGKIVSLRPLSQGLEIGISCSLGKIVLGESLAVNGCCLTITRKKGKVVFADLSHETLAVTSLGGLAKGSLVNLERPVRLSDRLGGHLVQGHVDGTGLIRTIRRVGDNFEVTITFPGKLRRYLIHKGSVTVDGISMTVNRLRPTAFTLMVIPHTWEVTHLHTKRVGERVNLEVDLVGKYIENLLKTSR